MSRVPVFLVLFASLVSRVAAAQTPDSLTVGARVRVAHRCRIVPDRVPECFHAGPPAVVVGELRALDADSIYVRTAASDAAVAIPKAFVTQIWVSDGTRSNFWAGAGGGLLGGALLGGMIGSQLEWCLLGSCSPVTGLGIGLGATAGFLVGGIVGSATHSDRWRAVSPTGFHLSLEPGPDALRFVASIRF